MIESTNASQNSFCIVSIQMKKQSQLQVAASKDLVKAEKEALKKVREQNYDIFSFFTPDIKCYCDIPFMIQISHRTFCVSVVMKYVNCNNLKIQFVLSI